MARVASSGHPTHRPALFLAQFAGDEAPFNSLDSIAEWAAGATVNNGEVLAGPRMAFMSGSREASGITSQTAGLYDLSADGEAMFLNAVAYMVPEPSTGLLSAFGLLVLSLFRKRRTN